jgi:hypothetical protein
MRRTCGGRIHEEHTGTVEIDRDLIMFRDKETGETDTYCVISLQQKLDGTAVLTVIERQYAPESANIRFYGEKWFRSTLEESKTDSVRARQGVFAGTVGAIVRPSGLL